jgi:BirA family biotin operon repressor/biotin-[acetyl-CoA-carboxylase] ligase
MVKDRYDLILLKKVLSEMGYDFSYFPKTDSTMNIIEKAAREGRKNLMIVLTDHQTQGSGRKGREWLDTAGNSLMFSVLFQIKESSIATFADLVSLSICETLRRVTGNSSIQIKYPNDLVYHDKKIGGILLKNIYDEKLHYLGTNLGIGLNIHYTKRMLEEFTTDYPSTSLDISISSFVRRQDLLIEILKGLRYLGTEAGVLEVNAQTAKIFDEKWSQASSMMGRNVVILKHDLPHEEGVVTNTSIGRGIELQTLEGRKWVSLFDTDMKARIVN